MFSIVRVQTKKVKERKKKPLRHCREKIIEKPLRSMPIAAQSPHSPKKRSKKHPTISTELRAGKRAVRALRTREEGATCGMLVASDSLCASHATGQVSVTTCVFPARCLYSVCIEYSNSIQCILFLRSPSAGDGVARSSACASRISRPRVPP